MRVLTGNKHRLPGGLSPQEWARRVFAHMDEGMSHDEAKRAVVAECEGEAGAQP